MDFIFLTNDLFRIYFQLINATILNYPVVKLSKKPQQKRSKAIRGRYPYNTYRDFPRFQTPSPFVTQNRTNPYILQRLLNKSLTTPRALRIIWTTFYFLQKFESPDPHLVSFINQSVFSAMKPKVEKCPELPFDGTLRDGKAFYYLSRNL